MKSFRNSSTGVLTAFGNVESNGSDTPRDEQEGFNLEPGKWQLVGDAWVPYDDTAEVVLNQINQIEIQTLMNRGSRELAMRQIEAEAAATATPENTVEQILAAQPFYVRLKQVDDEVSALRVQL